MKKSFPSFLAVLLYAVALSASAHVTLDPKEAIPGRQIYWVRVPNERSVPTLNIRLVVPEGVDVTSIIPASGWNYTVKRGEATRVYTENGEEVSPGKITEIIWSGGKVHPGELMMFGIGTNYQGNPTTIAWKAYQTYEGGEVVSWDDSNEKTPAPKVVVSPKTKIDTVIDSVGVLAGKVDALEKDKRVQLNQWMSGAALIVAVLAFIAARRKHIMQN